MNPDFTPIPNTPFVFLTKDANFAKSAIAAGTILLETAIADLPEVKALGPGDFVLDIGAFIGDTALIFAKNGASVVGFEAQVDAWEASQINIAGSTVAIWNLAIGDDEPVQMNQDPVAGNLGTRTVSVSYTNKLAQITTRLDDFFKFSVLVTFVKIDVEGFEPSVIRGAMKLFARDKPTLLIEVYPEMLARQGFTTADIYVPLLGLGYTITEAIGNSTEPRWDILCKMAP